MPEIEERQQIINEIIETYPKKVGQERRKHLIVRDPAEQQQQIAADVSTIPGVMTNRG